MAGLILALVGLLLVLAGNTFEYSILKIDVDVQVVNLGALFLVVGVLQWMFESTVRNRLVADISKAVLGNQRLADSGLADCLPNGREVNEDNHWSNASRLTIGRQYSPRLLEQHHDVLKARVDRKLRTLVLLLDPGSTAAEWLRGSGTGFADIASSVAKAQSLARKLDPAGQFISIRFHSRVMRYSFIATEEMIWIKFFTNSTHHATIPAFKICANSRLFDFFNKDMQELENASEASSVGDA